MSNKFGLTVVGLEQSCSLLKISKLHQYTFLGMCEITYLMTRNKI